MYPSPRRAGRLRDNSDMGNRAAKNAGREGGTAPLTVAESAGQFFSYSFC